MKCNLRTVCQEDGKGTHVHRQLTPLVALWTLTRDTPGSRTCTADRCSELLEQDGAERVPRAAESFQSSQRGSRAWGCLLCVIPGSAPPLLSPSGTSCLAKSLSLFSQTEWGAGASQSSAFCPGRRNKLPSLGEENKNPGPSGFPRAARVHSALGAQVVVPPAALPPELPTLQSPWTPPLGPRDNGVKAVGTAGHVCADADSLDSYALMSPILQTRRLRLREAK